VSLAGNTLLLAHAGDTFAGSIQDPSFVVSPGSVATATPTGSLVIAGGAEILSGTNTYFGGTTIANGAALQIGNGGTTGSISGNATDNGTLAFNRSDTATFAGAISGSGAVRQIGTGTTTLSANNSYGGGTDVVNGTLNVTGAIGSVVVENGAALIGTGKVAGTSILPGGRFSPGAASGTGVLMVNDSFTLNPGSTSVFTVTPTSNDAVTASKFAFLNGGSLIVNGLPGAYTIGTRYTLVTAASGFAGTTFSSFSLTGSIPHNASLSYDSNNVFLTLNAPTALALPSGLGSNQSAVANSINAALVNGAALNGGFNTLFGLSGAALGAAVTQLSGETGADAAQGASQSFSPFLGLLMSQGGGTTLTAPNYAPDQAYGADGAPEPAQLAANTVRIWGSAFGRHTGIAADPVSGAQGLKAEDAGLAAGVEMQVADNLLLGASVAGGHASFSAANGVGNSDDVMLGVYGRTEVLDRGYVAGAFSYGWHNVDTLRIITISGTDILAGSYTANDIGGRIEGGYRFALDDRYGLTPYAAFSLDDFQAPAYRETAASGSAAFALSYAAHDTDFAHSELGLRLGRGFALDAGRLSADVSAAWSHELQDDPFALVSFQALPGSSLVVHGIRPATDTALLAMGVTLDAGDDIAYGARFESQVGPGTTSIAGTANIAYRW
jgi:autotransporter-associated beta strand protein